MMVCPVCKSKIIEGYLCPVCGHDESQNVESYLSLVKISGDVKTLSEKMEIYQNKILEKRVSDLMEKQIYNYESQIKELKTQILELRKQIAQSNKKTDCTNTIKK